MLRRTIYVECCRHYIRSLKCRYVILPAAFNIFWILGTSYSVLCGCSFPLLPAPESASGAVHPPERIDHCSDLVPECPLCSSPGTEPNNSRLLLLPSYLNNSDFSNQAPAALSADFSRCRLRTDGAVLTG